VPDEQVATQETAAPPSRDAILAQLEALSDEVKPAADAVPVEDDTSEEDTDVEAASDEVDGEADTDLADEDEDKEPESKDAETQKRLDTVRRAEKRSRDVLAKDRADFDAERAKWAEKVAKVDEYEQAAKRAKYDPATVLRKLGVADDDFELIAQTLYAESKAGAADPKRKEQAARLLREREKEDKLSATEKRMADLEAKLEAQKQEQVAVAEASRFIEQVNTTAKVKFPLAHHLLTADPEDSSDGMVAAYDRLAKTADKAPTAAQVVAEFDRSARARLKKLGVDVDALVKTKPGAAVPTKKTVNGKSVAAPTNTNGTPKTRAQILAELDALAAT
jgi:hypothetical protein